MLAVLDIFSLSVVLHQKNEMLVLEQVLIFTSSPILYEVEIFYIFCTNKIKKLSKMKTCLS